METSGYEHRTEQRRPLDVYLNKFIGDEPYMARASDISQNGIYLSKLIEPELPEGSMVSLEFVLPNSDEVMWVRGAVMRQGLRWGTDGVGVWFTIVPERYRQIIEDYIWNN
jgi:hypothetical protein